MSGGCPPPYRASGAPPRSLRLLIAAFAGASLLAGTSLLTGCGGSASTAKPQAAAASPTATVTVTRTMNALSRSYEALPGTVRAGRSVAINARIPGSVARIDAEPGRRVAAGEVLMTLDAGEILARRDAATAAADLAASELKRAEELFAKQSSTAQELDAARGRARAAAAAAAEATVYAGYLRVTAPFAGVVVRKQVELGDLVAPGRALCELEDPTSLRLEVSVPESLSRSVALGDKLSVTVSAADFTGEAAVVEVTPTADAISRTVLVKLALPADHPRLRSGQFARVHVLTSPSESLNVPTAAVQQRGQLQVVFTVVEQQARMRLVRTGESRDGMTAIRAGLTPDDEVIVTGGERLVDGQPVTVNRSATP